jgi:4-hydroxybenzoate polyprenyltransferase
MHWAKNAFVLAPLIFAESADRSAVEPALAAFLFFCVLSSAVYAINDVVDAASDRLHPRKRLRPVASGRVSPIAALAFAGLLVVIALPAALVTLPVGVALAGTAYLINNALYVAKLRDHVIIDVISIASGFVLRLIAGAAAIAVEPTQWLLVCGFSVALLLGFGKRRTELESTGVGAVYRRSLQLYTAVKLDTLLAICASMSVLSYMLYTASSDTIRLHDTDRLVYTVPFVVYAVFRFIFKVQEGKGDGPVEILLSDRIFLLNAACWIISVAVILRLA